MLRVGLRALPAAAGRGVAGRRRASRFERSAGARPPGSRLVPFFPGRWWRSPQDAL